MKRRVLIFLLLCLALLAGCKTITRADVTFDGDGFSKAQRIVVHDAAGNEKAVLEEEEDIEAFVDAVNVEGWTFAEPPEGLTEAGSITLWQTETVTALIGEKEVNEICTFLIYREGDYLTIEVGPVDLPFSIPRQTADYLRGLTAGGQESRSFSRPRAK